jgi:hypothetical protein
MPLKNLKKSREKAIEITQAADEVPLASVSHVISKIIHRPITLWQRKNVSPSGLPRANVYVVNTTGEIFIFYDAPASGNARSDQAVRVVVAHELAHLVLRHPYQVAGVPSNTVLEKQADILGFHLADGHGAPLLRQKHNLAEVKDLLEHCGNLDDTEKNAILKSITDQDLIERKTFINKELRKFTDDANQPQNLAGEIEKTLESA